jgi:RHS repeat-associated protein
LARTDHHLSTIGDPNAHAFYHADGNGNITLLINQSQATVAKYIYDAFGNIISQSGSLAEANLYRFSSKECHAPSGLVYYLYRFYDPSLQRWLNRDPIKELGGFNLYEFVSNDPSDKYDRYGDMPQVLAGMLGGCAAGAVTSSILGLINGDSGGNIACKAGVSCGVGAVAGGLAAAFPPLSGCLAGMAASIAGALGKSRCDCSSSGKGGSTGCAVAGAIASAATGCAIGALPGQQLGGSTLEYILKQAISALVGNDVKGTCNL